MCAHIAHGATGAVSIFHAKQVILMMSVYSIVLARDGLVIGIPSPMIKIAIIIKETPPESCWYGGHPRIRLAMTCVCSWRGSKLYFYCLGTSANVLTWNILITLGHNVDMKGIPPKIIFIPDLSYELWHLCKNPASLCEGPIYLLLC